MLSKVSIMKAWKIVPIALIIAAIATFGLTVSLYREYQSLLPILSQNSYPWYIEDRIAQLKTQLIITPIIAIALLIVGVFLLKKTAHR